MCKYIKLGSNKNLWRMKGFYFGKERCRRIFRQKGKDFDLWAAAQHRGSSSITWSCSVTRARSPCVPSAMGDRELLTPQTQSALGALLLGRVWNVWTEHLHASSNRTEPSLSLVFGLKMPFVHCCVFGFHFGFENYYFFFRLDFEFCWIGWKEFLPSRARVILCGKGRDDTEQGKFPAFWKGLRVDWELLWDTGAVHLLQAQVQCLVSKVLVTLAQPPGRSHSKSHRFIQESASSSSPLSENTMEVIQLCHPCQGTSCAGLILGSWCLSAGEPMKKEWWLFWGQPVVPREGNKSHNRCPSPSSPCGTTLRFCQSHLASLYFVSMVCLHYSWLEPILMDSKSSLTF